MTKLYKYTAIIISFIFFSCAGKQSQSVDVKENLEMKAMLQGTWMDEDTETPMICIKGDSIHYMASGTLPIAFRIIEDSLITYGAATTSYHIVKQNEYMLWIQSEMGSIIKMNRAEESDSIHSMDFQTQTNKSEPTKEVIQKDRIELYKDVRYRGYVYINPSQIKVTRPTYSDEGFKMDNVYYDNIIHICVYEGKNKLFSKDVYKKDFSEVVPEEFLQWAILSDMEFIGINEKGYQYQATISIPDEITSYIVNLSISTDGNIQYTLKE